MKAAGVTDDLADFMPLLRTADRDLHAIENGSGSPAQAAPHDTVAGAVADHLEGDLATLDRAPLSVTFLGGRGDAWKVLMATARGETVTLRRLMRLAPRLRTPASAEVADPVQILQAPQVALRVEFGQGSFPSVLLRRYRWQGRRPVSHDGVRGTARPAGFECLGAARGEGLLFPAVFLLCGASVPVSFPCNGPSVKGRTMFATTRDDAALVIAAQRGDRRAMEALVAEYMPLVYNIVGLALDDHGDVDDVVQESLIRVVDHLAELREPAAFRSWLVAITVRQVRDRRRARRATPLMADSAGLALGETADPGADFVDLTILRLALSDQRRETALASRWLEPQDREALTLWWLESAGELSRAELADALDLPLSHTAVRIQRMKAQLDAARMVVRALAVPRRCAGLAAVAQPWDGVPSSVWRKRFARHTRDCVACGTHWNELVPAERLLAGLSLVPVPAVLAAKWLGFALATTAPSTGVGAGAAAEGAKQLGHGGSGGASLRAGRLAGKVVGRRRLLKAAVFGGAGVGVAGVAAAMMSKTTPAAQATSIVARTAGGAPATSAASASASPSASASASRSASATPSASPSAHPSEAVGAAESASASPTATGFVHPGLLHTDADFARMTAKVNAGAAPWTAGWKRLTASSLSQSTWLPNPQTIVYRGTDQDNYAAMYYDIHAAYQNGLRWKITGETAHAEAAVGVLNAWSAKMTTLTGDADRFIAAGIYGYQWCNAAELMRGYPGFDFDRFKAMMLNIFYPMNDSFLTNHNGAYITNYWASWDQLTMASILAIGILCDDTAKVDQAVDYYQTGKGMGAIKNAVPVVYSDGLGEWVEAGRDQGHATLGVGLTAAICEMAWSQGIDLYGYDDNRFMAGAEYVAQYNMGGSVPYTPYTWYEGAPGVWSASQTFTAASPDSRGAQRPIWEMIYNHYANRQGLSVPSIAAYAASMRPEGGGGDYGGASGGFDQLGHGTLAYTI